MQKGKYTVVSRARPSPRRRLSIGDYKRRLPRFINLVGNFDWLLTPRTNIAICAFSLLLATLFN